MSFKDFAEKNLVKAHTTGKSIIEERLRTVFSLLNFHFKNFNLDHEYLKIYCFPKIVENRYILLDFKLKYPDEIDDLERYVGIGEMTDSEIEDYVEESVYVSDRRKVFRIIKGYLKADTEMNLKIDLLKKSLSELGIGNYEIEISKY